MAEKVKGKVLNLIIKQVYFDQIIDGTKKKEYREVKPSTVNKLIKVDDEGYEVTDEHGNAQPIHYDYIRLFVGYNKDRDTALVEVKDAYCEMFTEPMKDENGKVMKFVADESGERPALFKVDENGDYVKDENGEYVHDENGIPMQTEKNGIEIDVPIEHSYLDPIVDSEGKVMKFVPEEGSKNAALFKVDENGEFAKDENGEYIKDDENGEPMPTKAKNGVPAFKEVVWVEEQVVYCLGKVVEKNVKPRVRRF